MTTKDTGGSAVANEPTAAQKDARRWGLARQFVSGDDFDRWDSMAAGGHIPSDDGNEYADRRADAMLAARNAEAE